MGDSAGQPSHDQFHKHENSCLLYKIICQLFNLSLISALFVRYWSFFSPSFFQVFFWLEYCYRAASEQVDT